MRRPIFVATLLLLLLTPSTVGAQYSTVIRGGEKQELPWSSMENSMVEIQGVVWGAYEKGLGAYLLLPNGRVYLSQIDDQAADLNGRIVHVAGVLIRKTAGGSTRIINGREVAVQGYSKSFDYFSINVVTLDVIERITEPQVLPSTSQWILPGMSVASIEALMQERNFSPVQLQLATPKTNLKQSAYSISQKEAVSFKTRNGLVESVAILKLNEPHRRIDDQMMPVRGYRLPGNVRHKGG